MAVVLGVLFALLIDDWREMRGRELLGAYVRFLAATGGGSNAGRG